MRDCLTCKGLFGAHSCRAFIWCSNITVDLGPLVRRITMEKDVVRQSHLPHGGQETDTGIDRYKRHPSKVLLDCPAYTARPHLLTFLSCLKSSHTMVSSNQRIREVKSLKSAMPSTQKDLKPIKICLTYATQTRNKALSSAHFLSSSSHCMDDTYHCRSNTYVCRIWKKNFFKLKINFFNTVYFNHGFSSLISS